MHQNWNNLVRLPQTSLLSDRENTALSVDMGYEPVSYPNTYNIQNNMYSQSMPLYQSGLNNEMALNSTDHSPLTPQQQEIYSYPQNLAPALKLIEEAVSGENEDRLFYQYLIDKAPTEQDKEIIRGIRENEITHAGLFRQIYSQITGRMLPIPEEKPAEFPASYCEGLQKALLGEEEAVKKYRRILFAMQNRVHINMLTEIITDELRHGTFYAYLLARNNCKA
jgi:rubrerythrin